MLIENLDRSWWTLQQARDHVAKQILAREPEPLTEPEKTARSLPRPLWMGRERTPEERRSERAMQELLIALCDGDLHATGRVSTNHNGSYQSGYQGWMLHSGHHSHIPPTDWLGGHLESNDSRLSTMECQYIDFRILRFAVLAIWPDVQSVATPTAYRTPYMELLERAIVTFGLSESEQSKKECLLEWFEQQEVEGERISNRLADAMATLVRLPSSQRGGAKRAGG